MSYGRGANDEGLLALLDASPIASPAAAPVVTAPVDGAALNLTATFAFQPSVAALGSPRRRGARERFYTNLSDLFTLERSAYAHGAPMNGEAFFLVFSTSHDARLLRVFLQDRTFTPDDTELLRLTSAHETLSLTVTRGVFEEGRLTSDGGPFVGKPVHFTISP